jgi:hypothetical protein
MSPITSQMTSKTAASLVAGYRPVRAEAMSVYRAITGSGYPGTGPGLAGRGRLATLDAFDVIVIFLVF